MEVRLLDYSSGVKRTMAILWVGEDGQLRVQGTVPPNIEGDISTVMANASSPEQGLRRMPAFFNGAYLRAELRR